MTWYHPKYYAEMRAERRKLQAASVKPQAPSANELDRDPGLGYSRINKTKPPLKVSAISAVSKAGTFRAVSPRIHAVTIKDSTVGLCTCPAVSSFSPLYKTSSGSGQSFKPQAASFKRQAASVKLESLVS
jgi:hypothetical protein